MGTTVTVGCKLPNGLILRLTDAADESRVTLAGANSSRVIGGYGMTEIDADFWAEWSKRHVEFEAFKNGVIFGVPKASDAAKEAASNEDVKTGLEPLDPSKSVVPGVSASATEA